MKLNEIDQYDKFFDALVGTYTEPEVVKELVQQEIKEKDLLYACEKFIRYLETKGFHAVREGSPVMDLLYDVRNEITDELFRVELYKTLSKHSILYIVFYKNVNDYRNHFGTYRLKFNQDGTCVV